MISNQQKNKYGTVLLLAVSVLCILYDTLFLRINSMFRVFSADLFHSYRLWFAGSGTRGKAILQNIALFIPFGYLLTAIRPSRRARVFPVVLAGFGLSLLVEAFQYFLGRGTADLDDLFNNTLGTALGSALCLLLSRIESGGAGKKWIKYIRDGFPLFLAAASIWGCFQMKDIVGENAPDVSSFDFEITHVDNSDGLILAGRCRTYDFSTPDYTIYLKGKKTTKAETAVSGDRFVSRADVPVSGKYEILIRFRGFSCVSTAVYLCDGSVSFVPDESISPPEDPRLEGAVMKAFSPDFDTYVFEKDGTLIWLIGYDIDDHTEIIYHITTDEPEKLPENRKIYGFDNRGFRATGFEREPLGRYRFFQKDLPDSYNITGVKVGLQSHGTVKWLHSFRVEKDGAAAEEALQNISMTGGNE